MGGSSERLSQRRSVLPARLVMQISLRRRVVLVALLASPEVSKEATEALAEDIHEARPGTPVDLIASEIDFKYECPYTAERQPQKPAGSIYREEVARYDPDRPPPEPITPLNAR